MSKGKAKVNYLNREGLVSVQNAPSWDFLYTTSAVKDPNYNIGDRVTLPDSREFRYAKSAGICYAGQGCEFTQIGLAGSALAAGQAVGDRQVTIVCASHAAIVEDELRGGYVIIHQGSNLTTQFRGIIGNLVSAANANITVYLDGALTTAVTTSTSAELCQNPYATLQLGANPGYPKAGIPTVYVDTANKYFWVQVKGPCWAAPQANLTGEKIGAYWRHDGSLDGAITSGLVANQYAGYRIVGAGPLVGPLFVLQG